MTNLLNLSSSLRIVLLAFMMIIICILLYSLIYLYLTKQKKLKILYYTFILLSALVMVITRTPIIMNINVILADILNLILICPTIISLILFIKEKKVIYLFDMLYFIINITYLSYISNIISYITSFSTLYLLIRTIFLLYQTLEKIQANKGILAIKDALDYLDDGIIFLNYFNKIIYINNSMKEILSLFNFSTFDNINNIISFLKQNGKIVTNNTYIISTSDKAYRFYFEITAIDVTYEQKLIDEEEKIKKELENKNKNLKLQLDEITKYQNETERMRLKTHIHDHLAQQLSILHMFVLNDYKYDLIKLKNILNEINISYNDDLSPIEDLINTYKLIDVNIHIDGVMPKDKNLYLITYDAIRECTTNTIKHGLAKDIFVIIKNNEKEYTLEIINEGKRIDKVIFGNGLNGLKEKAQKLNGSLKIDTSLGFKVIIIIPY